MAQGKETRQYYLPFTKQQLDTITKQINQATYKLNNTIAPSKDVSSAKDLLGQFSAVLWASYEAQERKFIADSLAKGKKP